LFENRVELKIPVICGKLSINYYTVSLDHHYLPLSLYLLTAILVIVWTRAQTEAHFSEAK